MILWNVFLAWFKVHSIAYLQVLTRHITSVRIRGAWTVSQLMNDSFFFI
jgi:hypothetical protein